MAEAAALAEARSDISPAELAARHGLHVAGARPGVVAYIRQLWAYRHFINHYSRAKLQSAFTTTKLGQLWQVLTPLANAAVYYLVFGVLVNTKHGIDNYIGYLCTGIFLFTFTQTVIQGSVRAIGDNLGMIRALHFPRAVLPISTTLTQLQQMGASVLVLLIIILLSGETPSFAWLLIIPTLLLQAVFNAGFAMIVARVGATVTDLKQIMPFILRTWLYASGVFYSVTLFASHLPGPLARVMESNPLLVYASLGREALLEEPIKHPMGITQLWVLAFFWAALFGIGGFLYFWRGEQEYGRG
jgi:teichoic acid transport system permease protein